MTHVYLPSESQRKLMELSRQALEDFVRGIEREREQIDDPYLQSREYGAFVSLHKKEELRGCIGNCAPKARLFETVTEMTQAAASRDPRVKPVAKKELAEIRIDITVLSPLEPLEDPLTLRDRQARFFILPRGKTPAFFFHRLRRNTGWDIKTFLEQTCLKAGLRKECLEGIRCAGVRLYCVDYRGATMKRRGFIGLFATALLISVGRCTRNLQSLLGTSAWAGATVQYRPGRVGDRL